MIPTAQQEVNSVLGRDHKPLNDLGFGPEMKFESRIQAAIRESKERIEKITAEQEAADFKGELWTVQAALYPGRVFCIVYHGRFADMEPLESQHGGAGAFLGPVLVTGKQKAVMAEALALFTVNEVTIRVIPPGTLLCA